MKNLFLITLLITGLIFKGYSQPKGNRGLYFDGVDDKISIPHNTSLAFSGGSVFTFEAWVKTNKLGTTQSIIGSRTQTDELEIVLLINPKGTVTFGLGKHSSSWSMLETSNSVVEANKWVHLAFVKDGSGNSRKIYVNGNEVSTTGGTDTLYLNATNSASSAIYQIGDSKNTGENTTFGFFNGQIDEVKIFNTTRNASQIATADMIATSNNGASAYWDFEDDKTAGNQTTTSNQGTLGAAANGTLTNGPLWALRVTKTTDAATDQGSLRWAINEANTDFDTDYIDFSIQQTNAATVSKITLANSLPTLTDSPIIIDGYSAYGSAVNTFPISKGNNAKLRVELDCSSLTSNLIQFNKSGTVKGFSAYGNNVGFLAYASDFLFEGNFIGVKADGTSVAGTGQGLFSGAEQTNVKFTGNVIGNVEWGIQIHSTNSKCTGNLIGVTPNGTTRIPVGNGVFVGDKGSNDTLVNNVIASTKYALLLSGSSNHVKGNFIGTDPLGKLSLGTTGGAGINIIGSNNIIGGIVAGEGNSIANNDISAISIESGKGNVVSGNSIYNNTKAIVLTSGGNGGKAAPVITSATPTLVSGTCTAGDVIEVFNDSPSSVASPQGRTYLGTTNVLSDNTWSFKFATALSVGTRITATATDATNGTSEFSNVFTFAPCTTLTVSNTNDAGTGSLRQAITEANKSTCLSLNIECKIAGTITLTSPLPIITKEIIINGNNITVSGDNKYTVFVINNVSVELNNLIIADGYAKGADGGNGITSGNGGGGGAGLGGGLFVLGVNSKVVLNNIEFKDNKAIGGNGGGTAWGFNGNGGGGGASNLFSVGIGGNGGNGGLTPTTPDATNGELFAGGGGAGNPSSNGTQGIGGDGGLFAGGGGAGIPIQGGITGVCPVQGGSGGFLGGAGGHSCGGSNPNGGGGGAGLGGALFVYQGKVTINNVTFNNNIATGGVKGNNAQNGQGKGAAIFVYSGATLIASGSNYFEGNVASTGLCTPTDNKAYYNINTTAPSFFPAQSEYSLKLTASHTLTSASLSWNFCGTEAITEYVLERSENDTLKYSVVSSSKLNSYTDNSLKANNTYYYRVKGKTKDGTSLEYSNYVVSTFKKPGSGNAITFDGVDDHILLPNFKEDFSGGITISLWVYPTSVGSFQRFVDMGNGPGEDNILFYRNGTTNDLNFDYRNGNTIIAKVEAKEALELNKWQHFAVSLSPKSTVTLYKNGIQIAQNNLTDVPNSIMRTKAYIGRSNWNEAYYAGQMDEISIWNKALTQADIRKYMCSKLVGTEAGLVLNLKMDEDKGYGLENYAFKSSSSGILYGTPKTVISGAPIGDVSTFNYSTSAGNGKAILTNTDVFTATYKTKAANQGVHIYKVNEAPNSLKIGTGLKSIEASRYFGVFPVGIDTFSTVYNYAKNTSLVNNSNESNLILANRTNNTNTIWNLLVDSKVNTALDTVSSGKRYNHNEFIAAFALTGQTLSPTLSSATDVKETSFVAHWSKVPSATGYVFDVATDEKFTFTLTNYSQLALADTFKLVTGLSKNQAYYYRVRALIGTDSTAYSSTRKVATTLVSGGGNTLELNGAYIEVPNHELISSLGSSTSFTLETWVKPSALDNDTNFIFAKGTINLSISNTNGLRFTAGTTTLTSTNNVSLDVWTHVALTYQKESSLISMYVNGVFQKSLNPTFTANTSALKIGSNFTGQLEETRVWNVARTKSEIQAAMCHKLAGNEIGLVVYFPMNEDVNETTTVENKAVQGILDGLILGTGKTSFTKSGAPIGDISVSLYENLTDSLVLNNGDKFTLNGIYSLTNNQGIQLYKVNGDCDVSKIPSDYTSYDKSRYFGTFFVNYYNGVSHYYSYENNPEVNSKEKLARFLVRQNGAVDSLIYENNTNKDYDTKTLELESYFGSYGSEYIIGFRKPPIITLTLPKRLDFGNNKIELTKSGTVNTSGDYLTYSLSDSSLVRIQEVYVGESDPIYYLIPIKNGKLTITATTGDGSASVSQDVIIGIPPYAVLGKKITEEENEETYFLSPSTPGLTYQWSYKSTTGKDALFVSEKTNDTVTLYYRSSPSEGILTCVVSNPNYDTVLTYSIAVKVYQKEHALPKVNCDSLISTISACSGNYIQNFKFEKIENLETGCSEAGYSDYTKSQHTTNLNLGSTYNATLKIGNNSKATNSQNYIAVWIDYDNNGSFDDPNEFLYSTYTSESTVVLKNILISSNFKFAGDHRLRIKVNSTGIFINESCLNYNESGETEDYKVTLLPAERLEAPVLITPNDDGKNDFFIIKGIKTSESNTLVIFNRAGNVVYSKENYNNTWSGLNDKNTLLPQDTYYYNFKNGSATISGYFELRY